MHRDAKCWFNHKCSVDLECVSKGKIKCSKYCNGNKRDYLKRKKFCDSIFLHHYTSIVELDKTL